jgi:hypothetical protein
MKAVACTASIGIEAPHTMIADIDDAASGSYLKDWIVRMQPC